MPSPRRSGPAGRFVMGDVHGFPDEYPQAEVTVDRPFYVGQLEVTNRQYVGFRVVVQFDDGRIAVAGAK
jgi:formylglycine-generating enzyme required for sulfatase activity